MCNIEALPIVTCNGEKEKDIELDIEIEKDIHIDPFESFWKMYPRKVKKLDAVKSWKKIKPSTELVDLIMTALESHKKSTNWVKDGGQFIPYPATWLNGQQWNDEVQEAQVDLFPDKKQHSGNNQMDIITELMEEYRGDGQRNSVEDPDTIDISLS